MGFALIGSRKEVLVLIFLNFFLQNGSVLEFDMRQTAGPIKSFNGLTSNPVHTVQSLEHDSNLPSGVRSILSASAFGLCQWNIGAEEG